MASNALRTLALAYRILSEDDGFNIIKNYLDNIN